MKRILMIACALLLVVACVGCSANTYLSFAYKVDTGENVKIKLVTNDGYSINSSVPFDIKHNDEVVVSGTFIKPEAYEQYKSAVESTEGAKLLDEGVVDEHQYFMWTVENKEWNYAVLLDGEKTGIILGSPASEEEAKEVFSRLTFTIEN